jgi:hypothetical protein
MPPLKTPISQKNENETKKKERKTHTKNNVPGEVSIWDYIALTIPW